MFGRVALHPFLFALYPIVFLIARNVEGQASFSSAVGPLLLVLASAAVALVVLWVLLRNPRKAAVVVSIYVLLFFSYGHVGTALRDGASGDSVLFTLWLLVAAAATVLVARAGGSFERPTLVLNALAAVLVAMNVVPIASHALEDPRTPTAVTTDLGLPADPKLAPGGKRDIYYLVFDRYANERILKRRYDFDNSDVLDLLENRGFYVAHDSVANHPRTGHSLASSLNMTYLAYLEREQGASTRDWDAIYRLLRDAKLTRYLKSLGYRYHHIGSWWNPTAETPEADVNHVYEAPSEFTTVLLQSTLWPAISERLGLEESFGRRAIERRRVHYQVESLLSVEDDPAPTFTLAHFLIPHPPFVFDRNGAPVTDEIAASRNQRENYLEHLLYTNKVIEDIVTELLDTDGEDPIIVIQSDEGPHPPRLRRLKRTFNWFEATDAELAEKLLILNAYYLPEAGVDQLYPTISPVNTFRVILNEYFGADLKLLPDRVFVYRDFHHPYDFVEVTEGFDR